METKLNVYPDLISIPFRPKSKKEIYIVRSIWIPFYEQSFDFWNISNNPFESSFEWQTMFQLLIHSNNPFDQLFHLPWFPDQAFFVLSSLFFQTTLLNYTNMPSQVLKRSTADRHFERHSSGNIIAWIPVNIVHRRKKRIPAVIFNSLRVIINLLLASLASYHQFLADPFWTGKKYNATDGLVDKEIVKIPKRIISTIVVFGKFIIEGIYRWLFEIDDFIQGSPELFQKIGRRSLRGKFRKMLADIFSDVHHFQLLKLVRFYVGKIIVRKRCI